MATIVWDKVGERIYHSGIDRGVLYLHDGTSVPWNGLVSVEESSEGELKSFYLDGVKYLQTLAPGDFSGKLKALTYPDEFDSVNGISDVSEGLSYYEQPPKSFGLSYRSMIGNDVEGTDLGYKIHIFYNLLAQPDAVGYGTETDSGANPVEFGWTLTGTPPKVGKVRPTVHITIDSRLTDPRVLALVESKLYGTSRTAPSLPPITEIGEYFGFRGALLIIDYGDGSWAAIDESDTFITMVNSTTFSIAGADATYLDSVTYTISSTDVDV